MAAEIEMDLATALDQARRMKQFFRAFEHVERVLEKAQGVANVEAAGRQAQSKLDQLNEEIQKAHDALLIEQARVDNERRKITEHSDATVAAEKVALEAIRTAHRTKLEKLQVDENKLVVDHEAALSRRSRELAELDTRIEEKQAELLRLEDAVGELRKKFG